tara:strand:- start:1000 stop:1980 length:981 start_codon:yes stop_codon:yes gene_type:complete
MEKICIIKYGALGDVVRTTPLLEAIKEKFPESEITWRTIPRVKEILEGNPSLDKILTSEEELGEDYDILYSLDIDKEPTQLANKIKAEKKYGFFDMDGFPMTFNSEAEYYLNLVFDDDLKIKNRKTVQEMFFEICNLPYKQQPISINITGQAKQNIRQFLEENNLLGKKIVGFNSGAGSRWPSKAWHLDKIKECIKKLKEKDYEIILLGGPEEIELMDKLKSDLEIKGIKVHGKNTCSSIQDFFALINACDKVICADTLASHVALGLKKPTVELFFCTPPWEIEPYNTGKKITSNKLMEFFPEKMDQYDEDLVKSIEVDDVINLLG